MDSSSLNAILSRQRQGIRPTLQEIPISLKLLIQTVTSIVITLKHSSDSHTKRSLIPLLERYLTNLSATLESELTTVPIITWDLMYSLTRWEKSQSSRRPSSLSYREVGRLEKLLRICLN